MKKLVTFITLVLLSTSSFAMECAKINGRLYPADAQAQALASVLKVKTCSGKAFRAAVEKYGSEIAIVDATVTMQQEYNKAANERLEKRIGTAKISEIFETKKPVKK